MVLMCASEQRATIIGRFLSLHPQNVPDGANKFNQSRFQPSGGVDRQPVPFRRCPHTLGRRERAGDPVVWAFPKPRRGGIKQKMGDAPGPPIMRRRATAPPIASFSSATHHQRVLSPSSCARACTMKPHRHTAPTTRDRGGSSHTVPGRRASFFSSGALLRILACHPCCAETGLYQGAPAHWAMGLPSDSPACGN
jgi:hypothetical protein